ncbi:hypothetical protein WS71_22695 [Burkholderia mayonis]|uniref:Beta-lactamase n=1 Tax=Burkholderia mayonis TaxID=1385591 RepID=A0A1B4G2D5_9BURK|nr:hypothetical protein WS71_22695 [Burkholderia mayonis]KVE49015.1 hypothetical protein WS71_17155 [Burkholderia mayonis]
MASLRVSAAGRLSASSVVFRIAARIESYPRPPIVVAVIQSGATPNGVALFICVRDRADSLSQSRAAGEVVSKLLERA